MKTIEEYKKGIDTLLQDNIKDGQNVVTKLLKNDFENNKISKEDYTQLLKYIAGIKEKRDIQEKNKKNEEFRKEIQAFKESIRIKVAPIYKGEFGKVAPGRKKENKNDKEVER